MKIAYSVERHVVEKETRTGKVWKTIENKKCCDERDGIEEKRSTENVKGQLPQRSSFQPLRAPCSSLDCVIDFHLARAGPRPVRTGKQPLRDPARPLRARQRRGFGAGSRGAPAARREGRLAFRLRRLPTRVESGQLCFGDLQKITYTKISFVEPVFSEVELV